MLSPKEGVNPSLCRGEAGRGAEAESYVPSRPHPSSLRFVETRPDPPPTGEGVVWGSAITRDQQPATTLRQRHFAAALQCQLGFHQPVAIHAAAVARDMERALHGLRGAKRQAEARGAAGLHGSE